MDSLLWSYLGSRRFPRELSSFLVWRFFTLSSDDRLMSAPELTTLRALYRRPMTLFLHQRLACEYAGFHRHDASDVRACQGLRPRRTDRALAISPPTVSPSA
jgi:hypothetical protein